MATGSIWESGIGGRAVVTSSKVGFPSITNRLWTAPPPVFPETPFTWTNGLVALSMKMKRVSERRQIAITTDGGTRSLFPSAKITGENEQASG
jgi:hypothetical protein